MSRLIDADALKRNILCWKNCYNGYSDAYDKSMIIGAIEEMPTVDAERHGHWISVNPDVYGAEQFECSVCGVYSGDGLCRKELDYEYCPNCGALMDEIVDANKIGEVEK